MRACHDTFSMCTTTDLSWTRREKELPDAQAAWREATVTAGQIIQDLNGRLRPDRGWRIEVTDEFANRLYVIHLYAEKPK